MFKAPEETITRIVSGCIWDAVSRLDRLTEETKGNNQRLNELDKETEDLKLSLDASHEVLKTKIKTVSSFLNKLKS